MFSVCARISFQEKHSMFIKVTSNINIMLKTNIQCTIYIHILLSIFCACLDESVVIGACLDESVVIG